ncbi:MAG: hypothetical protein H7249_17200 [Chitinophagaceae bacterium]|nr:hypothetical protein [Oligoflexus sp.]
MKIPFKVCCSFALIVLIGLSCAPEGDLGRSLHPPHKRYMDRSSPQSLVAVAQAPKITPILNAKGLPEACKTEVGNELCVRCQADTVAVNRCYHAPRSFDSKSDCQYNAEHVKCLTKNPPFALYLEWRSSNEKFLRENFLLWRDTVHQIWDNRLTNEDREESDRILQSLDGLTRAFSTQMNPGPKESEAFVKALNLTREEDKTKAQELVADLQKQRMSGRISLSLLLEKMNGYYVQAHGASSLWTELRTISLEGLEE